MNKVIVLTFVALFTFASYVPLGVYANSTVMQTTTTPGCPTYLTNIIVDLVNSSPTQTVVGVEVTTEVHVVYPDGTPVTLSPQTISFLWNGTAGSKEFDNVAVNSTGSPGFYNYTQTITPDLVQATLGSAGTGTITVYVVMCSCSDALANRGPTTLIGSDETLTPSDDSHVSIGPQPSTQPPYTTYLVPILIGLLILLALILLLRRRQKGK